MKWFWIATSVIAVALASKKAVAAEPLPTPDPQPDPPPPPDDGEPPTEDPMTHSRDVMPATFANFTPPALPDGYRRAKQSEVPSDIGAVIRPFLAKPLGSVTFFTHAGKDFAAVIEPHFHEPGGPVKPWGWHKGVSLFIRPVNA